MKKETIYEYLRRRLTGLKGQHTRISKEAGIPQSTLSRLHIGQSCPRLETAQNLLDWFDRYDQAKGSEKKKSAPRFSNTKNVRVSRSSGEVDPLPPST